MPRAPDNAADRAARSARAAFREAQGLPARVDGHRTPAEGLARATLDQVAEQTLASYAGTQYELLPRTAPVPNRARILTTAIHGANVRPASSRMLESVRRLGILQPVVLVEMHGHRYRVIAGRRRVWCARELGQTYVPATVYPQGTPTRLAAAISVAENLQRAPNVLSDAGAVRVMLADGATPDHIQESLGLTDATMRVRLRYATMHEGLFEAATQGHLNMALLYRCSRCTPAQQRHAYTAFTMGGEANVREFLRTVQAPEVRQEELLPYEEPPDMARVDHDRVRVEGELYVRAAALRAAPVEVGGESYGAVTVVNNNRIQFGGRDYTHRDLRRTRGDDPETPRVRVDSVLVESWDSVAAFLTAAIEAIPPCVDDATDEMATSLHRAMTTAQSLARV